MVELFLLSFLSFSFAGHRERRDLADAMRMPGTRWCGRGWTADNIYELVIKQLMQLNILNWSKRKKGTHLMIAKCATVNKLLATTTTSS